MFSQIFYGLLGTIGGMLLTIYAYQIVEFTGRIEWAERMFGGAGTYTAIRIIGIFLTFFFFLYMFGLIGVVYLAIVNFIYSVLG